MDDVIVDWHLIMIFGLFVCNIMNILILLIIYFKQSSKCFISILIQWAFVRFSLFVSTFVSSLNLSSCLFFQCLGTWLFFSCFVCHQLPSVVNVSGCTQVKIFFRLCLQNLFPCVHPQTVARVEAMVSMTAPYSKVEAMVSMTEC